MLLGITPVWSHSELLLTSIIGTLLFDNSIIWELLTSTISANTNFVFIKKININFIKKNYLT